MKTLHMIAVVLLSCSGCGTLDIKEPSLDRAKWTYSGNLHKRIKRATSLRVNSSCYVQLSETNLVEIVLDVSDRSELDNVYTHLTFVKDNEEGHCRCVGERTFRWFRKTRLLAEVTLHHNSHMRWQEWPGDAYLTETSRKWLTQWLETRDRDFMKKLREANNTSEHIP